MKTISHKSSSYIERDKNNLVLFTIQLTAANPSYGLRSNCVYVQVFTPTTPCSPYFPVILHAVKDHWKRGSRGFRAAKWVKSFLSDMTARGIYLSYWKQQNYVKMRKSLLPSLSLILLFLSLLFESFRFTLKFIALWFIRV